MTEKIFDKYVKLNLLKYIVRPVRKVENNDVIKSTELLMDKALSIIFKNYLNFSGFHSFNIPTSYGKLHYYDSDPTSNLIPIIFVHGVGCSGQNWYLLARMLKNKRRVIMPDLFHMGGFSKPNNPVMDLIQHADSLLELIKHLKIKEIDICGLSLGGWISAYFAATQKNLIRKMILMNPAGVLVKPFELRDTITYLSWKKFKFLYPGILKAFPYNGVPFFSAATRRSAYINLKRKEVLDLLRITKIEHFIDDILPDITCPVLLLWGRDDKFLSPRIPIIFMKKIKNIQGKWIENCAHGPALEAPTTCYLEMSNFLNIEKIQDNEFTRFMLSIAQNHVTLPIQQGFDNDY